LLEDAPFEAAFLALRSKKLAIAATGTDLRSRELAKIRVGL
jgi:hypothetical protein